MYRIRPLKTQDLEALREFTDREIGAGYYSQHELENVYRQSQVNGVMCSLIVEVEHGPSAGEIAGVRISYPPGQWQHGKGHGLKPELWPHSQSETAYFQSLFLSQVLQGQGWGGRVSREAIRILKAVGAKGIVCHSWKQSPHNSSTRYLQKLGFETVAEHPEYWRDVLYDCTVCLKPPCRCTAQEMYLDLLRKDPL